MRLAIWFGSANLLLSWVCSATGIGIGVGTNVSRGDNAPMDFYRVNYQWDWGKSWFKEGNWFINAHNELSVIRVISDVEVKRKFAESTLSAVAFTPIFRLRRVSYSNGWAPFIEGGIGVSYFSGSKIQSQAYSFRDYGGRFQFEDRVSFGLLYQEKYKLSVDYTHYSNADIHPPNDGLDVVSISVAFDY